jgi:RhoGEF domain
MEPEPEPEPLPKRRVAKKGGCRKYRLLKNRHFASAGESVESVESAAEKRDGEFFEQMRSRLMKKFAADEHEYGRTLLEVDPGIKAAFVSQVKSGDPLVSNVIVTDIFGKVATLVVVSMDVGAQLSAAADDDWQRLTAMFSALNEYMPVYREYSMHYKSASYTLHRLMQSLPADHALRNVLNAVNLHALLRLPLERLDEYQATLTRVRDLTSPSAPEYAELCAAVRRMLAVVGSLEERRERHANAELLLDFQKLLVANKRQHGSVPLNFTDKKERRFVGMQRFASVALRHRKEKRYRPGIVWLLSDMLVVTCDAPGNRYKLLSVINLLATHIIVSAETATAALDEAGGGGDEASSSSSIGGASSIDGADAAPVAGWLFSITSTASSGGEQSAQRVVIEAPNQESRRLWMDTITSIVMDIGRTGSARRLAASLSSDKLLEVAVSSSSSAARSSAPPGSKAKRAKRLRRRSGVPSSATAASLENVAAATAAASTSTSPRPASARGKARRVHSCDHLEVQGQHDGEEEERDGDDDDDDDDDEEEEEEERTPRRSKNRSNNHHHHKHKHRKHRKTVSDSHDADDQTEKEDDGGGDGGDGGDEGNDDDEQGKKEVSKRARLGQKSPRKRYPGSLKEPIAKKHM